MTAAEWGVPNWRDASAYARADDLAILEWWWEFIRRNPDYRKLWLHFSPKQDRWVEENIAQLEEMARQNNVPLDWYIQQKRYHAKTDDRRSLQRRFHINYVLNPSKGFHKEILSSACFNDSAWGLEYGTDVKPAKMCSSIIGELQEDEANGRRLISFNLARPLDGQLEFAKEHLEEEQKQFAAKKVIWRPRKRNWPLFLRALDARDAQPKATWTEMAHTFWPKLNKTSQAARDTHIQAVQLRDNFPI